MPVFHATLQSQTDEHKRFVTLSRVPCPKCGNDPYKRGGYTLGDENGLHIPPCKKCDGRGDVPATRDSAAAHLEAMEAEYASFRLDEPETLIKYAQTLPADALERIMETTVYHPQDQVLLDGRFIRGGKVLASGAPGLEKTHKGWRQFHEQEKPYKVLRIGRMDEALAVTGGQYGVPAKNRNDGTTNGAINWASDTFKTALATSSYTVDIDTHDFFNDVTNEVTGTGYTAGGATLASTAASYDTATDQARFDAADTSWTTSTITARISVTYKSTGTASTSPLICFLNFGADVSTTAGTFQITWDATGIWIVDVT